MCHTRMSACGASADAEVAKPPARRPSFRSIASFAALITLVACNPPSSQTTQQPPPQYPPPGYAQYPQPYPQQPSPPGYPQTNPAQPQPAPAPQPAPPAATPLLPPLVSAQWHAEVQSVLAELIGQLSPTNQARVKGIPLVFDPDQQQVNAYAGCDDNGAPFLAGTEALLAAADAMAQTRATDELFGTQTYEAYLAWAAPRAIQQDGGSPALPGGIIPAQYWGDARRFSRAHELFDEIVAFTFGHELSHHYLGHTGCANGQPLPGLVQLGHVFIKVLPGFNQPNEAAADTFGIINTLDTGRARRGGGYYAWTEKGALMLLDFFLRVERAAGMQPISPAAFLRTHPSSTIRMPIVQTAAGTWHLQHPG